MTERSWTAVAVKVPFSSVFRSLRAHQNSDDNLNEGATSGLKKRSPMYIRTSFPLAFTNMFSTTLKQTYHCVTSSTPKFR
jgi:hypothetical protein